LALSAVAFAFYLKYVGKEEITFYTMLKVTLICLISPISLKILKVINDLKQHNTFLLTEKKELQKQLEKYKNEILYQTIDFLSENASENLSLMISEVMLIKSADNYIEVVYQEGTGNIKKKLLRSTLKNAEVQLKPYPVFVRCHRICIVNTLFIEKIDKDYSSHWIVLKGYDEKIPLSRQYLLKIKESA
jgi:DNA-binding LytR/AlgR family response regulator